MVKIAEHQVSGQSTSGYEYRHNSNTALPKSSDWQRPTSPTNSQ